MSPDVRKEIFDLPRAIRETLEKGRSEYEQSVRQTRWGELPIYFLGSGSGFPVGLFGARAFESLLDWPAVARTPADFRAYAASSIPPRTIVIFVSDGQGSAEALETAQAIKARNGIVLVLANRPDDPLGQAADGVFLVRAGEERGVGIRLPVCQQAAVGFIGLLAAYVLKRHRPQFDALENEFAKLPDHVEWVLAQLLEGVSSLASELARVKELTIVAGGLYYPAALQAVTLFKRLAGLRATAVNATELLPPPGAGLGRDETLLVLTGSRCRVKKHLQGLVEAAKRAGTNLLAVTDGSDPEVVRRSDLALLLPTLSELVGSTLGLALLQWTACHVPSAKRSAAQVQPPRGTGS